MQLMSQSRTNVAVVVSGVVEPLGIWENEGLLVSVWHREMKRDQ